MWCYWSWFDLLFFASALLLYTLSRKGYQSFSYIDSRHSPPSDSIQTTSGQANAALQRLHCSSVECRLDTAAVISLRCQSSGMVNWHHYVLYWLMGCSSGIVEGGQFYRPRSLTHTHIHSLAVESFETTRLWLVKTQHSFYQTLTLFLFSTTWTLSNTNQFKKWIRCHLKVSKLRQLLNKFWFTTISIVGVFSHCLLMTSYNHLRWRWTLVRTR